MGRITDHLLIIDRSYTAGELKQTRTRRGRTVKIVPPLMADIMLLRPKLTSRGELVAPNQLGQPNDLRLWRRRVWQPGTLRAGIEATPYDGRHTHASLLIHEGRSMPYVTAALGHATATMSLGRYAHLYDEARLATATPMVDAITDARVALERSGVRR